jgi:uncharacterized membrane protein YbhN (UPF0104 family)
MKSQATTSRDKRLASGRMAILTLLALAAYTGFIHWTLGWRYVLAQMSGIGLGWLLGAQAILVSTYFLRCWRIADYFRGETSGRFLALFRLTQVHNLLNIMLPFRVGETSFPLLMRAEFAVPLARGTAALLVMRLLDMHALFAAAGVGLVLKAGFAPLACLAWLFFLLSPLGLSLVKRPVFAFLHARLSGKPARLLADVELGVPADTPAFLRAWFATVVNWGVKVAVLAWALMLAGVTPAAAGFGGSLGGELSSVLPVHAPGGVGTYPAGIMAGALSFGSPASGPAFATLASAAVSIHLLVLVSAFAGTGLALLLSRLFEDRSAR